MLKYPQGGDNVPFVGGLLPACGVNGMRGDYGVTGLWKFSLVRGVTNVNGFSGDVYPVRACGVVPTGVELEVVNGVLSFFSLVSYFSRTTRVPGPTFSAF